MSCAVAGPILYLLGEESGGVHFYNNSSIGKTTAAVVAGSVWGGGDKDGFIETWRTTDNALELTAAAHNDAFFALDEIGQCDPKHLMAVPYLLSNGQSKSRMNKDQGSQQR